MTIFIYLIIIGVHFIFIIMNKDYRDLILFVNTVGAVAMESIKQYGKIQGKKYRFAVVRDSRRKNIKDNLLELGIDLYLSCDFSKSLKIAKLLFPYQKELLAIVCRGDGHIPDFAKIIPHVPYLRTPTSESLRWATDKIEMREHLSLYDKKIAPAFVQIKDVSKKTIAEIKEKVGFPLMIKPACLATSLLVNLCFHEEELVNILNKAWKRIHRLYKEYERKDEPRLLAEQFMDGNMYSIDAYVSARGSVSFCPMVFVKTGRNIGFDDFFGYQQMTPSGLKRESIEAARAVALKSIYALGLRSTSAHIELMKMENEWKIIEVGARIGGFRHDLYKLSYGIDHSLNDFLVRIGKQPIIPKKFLGYSTALKIFAKKEGRISHLKGIKTIEEFKSVVKVDVNLRVGDRCAFSKNGGKSVCNIILFNLDKAKFLADIRRIEQTLIIKVDSIKKD